MSSSDRLLFNRQTSVHQILGGGRLADLILWRHKNVTMGILMITLVSWVMFERSNYTLLSYVSNVLLLLLIILFLWAKSAQILNRPTPPIPHFQLSEETINEAAALFRDRINRLLTISHDIALGKDPKMFVKVAVYLVLISVIGSLTDLRTLCYTSVFLVLTVPALYERYEEHVDSVILKGNMKLKQLYNRYDEECIKKVRKWILEKNKLS
ncbi:reticulon-like protein B12 isoform X1 [Cynara cardunculus var. scolymus]|uniref:reticulon-like protein B12 isoform X1 n=1 Tax=Cynara cardunculus var. scolymus TaxID=59895 RepID=UPI000D62C645|nr:reticulon-like protein B12 isoform X1 [Cynara cardunculus var. scolymus]